MFSLISITYEPTKQCQGNTNRRGFFKIIIKVFVTYVTYTKKTKEENKTVFIYTEEIRLVKKESLY